MTEIVLATGNLHKAKEIKAILNGLNLRFLTLRDFPDLPETIEDGKTSEENALKKAKEIAKLTGKIALADDSGIEVQALNNAPGIFSARFAGKKATDSANNKKLLGLLKGIPIAKRKARFVCVIAIAEPAGKNYTAEGELKGAIALKPAGKKGFGYDPLFIVSRYKKTVAQLSSKVKNRISHRAKALKKAKEILKKLFGGQNG